MIFEARIGRHNVFRAVAVMDVCADVSMICDTCQWEVRTKVVNDDTCQSSIERVVDTDSDVVDETEALRLCLCVARVAGVVPWWTDRTEHVPHLRELIVEWRRVQRVGLRIALRVELFRYWHVIGEHNVHGTTHRTRTGQRGIERVTRHESASE